MERPLMPSNPGPSIERCNAEIAECERLLREGHPDLLGLCLALSDWSWAKRMIEARVDAIAALEDRGAAGASK